MTPDEHGNPSRTGGGPRWDVGPRTTVNPGRGSLRSVGRLAAKDGTRSLGDTAYVRAIY